ncbi:MAG: sulfurtransferase [Phaeodactylibacter sp.]|nr:sulfurtransferase [Phaeodactylibacter sp.]MCB9288713.1 sulfurtransferase [Lewinellaceae bacterium]
MKMLKVIASFLAFLLLASFNLRAQGDIISADEFMNLIKADKTVVIVDANKPGNYEANHVKGAINIYHNDLYQEGEIAGLIRSPEELAAFFGEKGISETTPVVIYDDGSQKYSSRVYWILKYLGAENVKLLHKDMDAWRKARIPLTAQPSTLAAVTFKPNMGKEELMAGMGCIKKHQNDPHVVIVDNRTADEYNGVSKSEGHLPGAININYEDLLTETGAFKPAEELQAIADAHGITPDKEVIFYCRTSVRAAVAFAAFRNILGYKDVKVYDGAYLEWAASNPVVQ